MEGSVVRRSNRVESGGDVERIVVWGRFCHVRLEQFEGYVSRWRLHQVNMGDSRRQVQGVALDRGGGIAGCHRPLSRVCWHLLFVSEVI